SHIFVSHYTFDDLQKYVIFLNMKYINNII
ncbi:MAG: hypothetical protein K0R34_4019, partial [Herbinix sp.]|nr:hypothetical protein [Herbinix sp.]